MMKYDIKQENDQTQSQYTYLNKVQTLEGYQIYLQTTVYDYVPNEKNRFIFGTSHVFIDKQGIKCYKTDIVSLESFNKEVAHWNQQFYDRIIDVLSKQPQGIIYSFYEADETEQYPCDFILQINELLFPNSRNKSEVTLLRLYLKYQPQLSNLDQLFKICYDMVDSRNTKINKLEYKNKEIQDKYNVLLRDIEKQNQRFKERENEILQKFVLLLNEKKKKIRELSNINGLLKDVEVDYQEDVPYHSDMEDKELDKDMQQRQPQSKQMDFVSQFVVSQPFDTFFSQAQNQYKRNVKKS